MTSTTLVVLQLLLLLLALFHAPSPTTSPSLRPGDCDFDALVSSVSAVVDGDGLAGALNASRGSLWRNCTLVHSLVNLEMAASSSCPTQGEEPLPSCNISALIEAHLLPPHETATTAVFQACILVRDSFREQRAECLLGQPEPEPELEPSWPLELQLLSDGVALPEGRITLPYSLPRQLVTLVSDAGPDTAARVLGRSYNGHPWEGVMPSPLRFDCTAPELNGSCGVALLNGSTHSIRITNSPGPPSTAAIASRFLTQATFG